jgi:hypothetical protein
MKSLRSPLERNWGLGCSWDAGPAGTNGGGSDVPIGERQTVSGISAASRPRTAHIMSVPKLTGHICMTFSSEWVQPKESKVPHSAGFWV